MDRDGFHDVLFPAGVSMGARGGPRRSTDITTLASGAEVRRSRWLGALRSYDVACGIRSFSDAEEVLHFFEARQGRRYAFRFRDPFDHSSGTGGAPPSPTDQTLGMGDGAALDFSLAKAYGDIVRAIELAVAGSVRIAVDGAELTGWSLNENRSGVVFDQAPQQGSVITAGFLFDTPVRFTEDRIDLQLGVRGASLPAIGLTEVRL